jgi:competence protein ComEA
MLARTAALALVLLASFLPVLLRPRGPPAPGPVCAPQGRGVPPRHWLGCATDAGPPRDLAADERLVLGLPLDLNRASATELAWIPGLSPRLAGEVVAYRDGHGPFERVDDLLAVKGIGPRRLERARPRVSVEVGR